MSNTRCVFLYIICDRKRKDELEEVLHQSGAALINCVFGRGYYENRNILDYLGFGSKKGKAIITCILSREKSVELIDKLNNELGFKKPDTGIAFTIPVDSIVY